MLVMVDFLCVVWKCEVVDFRLFVVTRFRVFFVC